MLLWIHPVVMSFVILFTLYVLALGFQRFRSAFLGHRVSFAWERHVLLGKIVLALIVLGGLFATSMTFFLWDVVGNTELHFRGAIAMIPLVAVAYFTGRALDSHRKRRTILPLVHFANNLVLCSLALAQVYTGITAIYDWVL